MAKLGNVCEIAAGQGAPQGENSYCNCNEGIPFIKAGDLSDLLSGKLETEIQCVNEIVAKQHKLKLYPAGSILFAKSGMSCMKGYVYRTKNPCYIVSHLAIVIPQGIDGEYLKYYFQHNKPNALIKDSAYPSISLQDISNIELTVPSLDIQASIASELNKVNMLISLRKQQLSKLDELVKSRFIELFGDPVNNSKGLPELTLPELGEFGRGVSKHRPRNDPKLLGGKYPLIQTGEVANSELYITSYENTYSELGLKQSKMWQAGTLCITIAANIAKTAILTFDACFPDSVVGFKANDRTNNIFIHYWFSFFQAILEAQAPESAQKNINLKILSELKIIVPPIEQQNEFVAFVEQTDKSKFEIQKSLEKLETLKKALMQKYFG